MVWLRYDAVSGVHECKCIQHYKWTMNNNDLCVLMVDSVTRHNMLGHIQADVTIVVC